MSGFTCEDLGLNKADLVEMVVERMADSILSERTMDEDGNDCEISSSIERQLKKTVLQRINSAVTEIGERDVAPVVLSKLEELVIQETNRWGEKKGESLTFVEYLTARAESYLGDDVNSNGKSERECSEYDRRDWHASGTRLSKLMAGYLDHHIKQALEPVAKNIDSLLADALTSEVKIQLGIISEKLSVKVVEKR
jgi:hypothetical protein